MASYDNLLAEQPWSFCPAFPDAWISDLFAMEKETLTKALQSSITGDICSAEIMPPLYSKADTTPLHTPTASGVSSENEVFVSKQRCSIPPSGRVAKHKSRPLKRAATTTFFEADPENFMRMVQQVTGGSSGLLASVPVLKPEPWRAAYGLPTLDTSAFLLDSSASSLLSPPSTVGDGGAGASERYFESFCSFPTLESWNV